MCGKPLFATVSLSLAPRLTARTEMTNRTVENIVTGAFTPLLAKHSTSFSLIDRISIGVHRMQRDRGRTLCSRQNASCFRRNRFSATTAVQDRSHTWNLRPSCGQWTDDIGALRLCFPPIGSRCCRCPNRWIDPVLVSNPTVPVAGVGRDSGLQSLQSGGSASVAVRLPSDKPKCRPTVADSFLSVQDRYN